MPAQKNLRPVPDPQYLDEHHQRISEFGAEYFDDDDEREAFVDTLMERRGYKRTNSWAPPDPEPEAEEPQRPQQQPTTRKPAYFRR